MKSNATYKRSYNIPHEDRYYIQVWEYRGREYEVEIATSWTGCSSDYLSGGYMSQYNQHRRAQAAIDEAIDNPTPAASPEEVKKAQEDLQKAIDMMFEDR